MHFADRAWPFSCFMLYWSYSRTEMRHLSYGTRVAAHPGIAWYPTDGHDLLTLKKYADFAMYQVKHSHKGRMCDFDIGSYHQEAYAAQTQQDFERLLQEELVSYHFQPIYSARSGRVAAYEALMQIGRAHV